MRDHFVRIAAGLGAALMLTAGVAMAQHRAMPSAAHVSSFRAPVADAAPNVKLTANQTLGFGANKLLLFNYGMQFMCVVQPFDDRNYTNLVAARSPAQFNFPQCQVGAPSKIDPTGERLPANPLTPPKMSDPLWVIVPFFETNPNTPAFTPQLGATLKSLFGFVPDGFKPNPGVPVQCPAPADMPGQCTMHPIQVDLGPVLAALKLIPPHKVVNVPLPDHSHIVSNIAINQKPEWWQVIVVLVTNPKAWPNAAGTKGITSLAKLRAAQKDGMAYPDVPTNFFLYFGSKVIANLK